MNVETMREHTIGTSILISIKNSLQIADQIKSSALILALTPTLTLLLPLQYLLLPLDNIKLE